VTIGKAGERLPTAFTPPGQVEPRRNWVDNVEMVNVESGDVLAMRDESLSSLLDEINAKQAQLSLAVVLGWGLGGLGLLLLLFAGAGGVPFLLLGLLGWAVGTWVDSFKRTSVLFYDLTPEAEAAYKRMTESFDRLASCHGKWHVEAGGAVRDLTTWKRNAGASHLIRKKPTVLGYSLPRAIKCNLTPPALRVGKQVIYFLPDAAFVVAGPRVGAVSYKDLNLQWQDSNFIEDGAVPRDAQVVGHVWKHPNKNGGPDRRFNNNYQIPLCRYEALHLRSTSGIHELVEFSCTGVSAPFAAALRQLYEESGAKAAGRLALAG
jgi:hypothetical protein